MSASAPNDTFESRIGLAYDHVNGNEVAGHIDVRDDILNGQHIVPLGVLAAIAESAAWEGTISASSGHAVLNLENNTTMTGTVHDGRISVMARLLGRTSDCWTWSVACHDDAERLCATSIVLVAVR